MQTRQSSSWYDVLAFLSLAAGLGLACGIALGGIALLLASPAYGAPAPEVEEGEYQQSLQHDDNLFSPRFPMVVAPRHIRPGPRGNFAVTIRWARNARGRSRRRAALRTGSGSRSSPSCSRSAPGWRAAGLLERRLLLAQLADRRQLRSEHRQLAFDDGELLLVLGGAPGFLGALERFARLRFVQILAANRGIGEHGDHFRLHFENAAGNEDKLLLAAARRRDAHLAGLDPRNQRRGARVDA